MYINSYKNNIYKYPSAHLKIKWKDKTDLTDMACANKSNTKESA